MEDGGSIDLLSSSFEIIASQARTIQTCQHLLGSLDFQELNHREESIFEAHANTFQWIFKDPELGFIEWASAKNGKSASMLDGSILECYGWC